MVDSVLLSSGIRNNVLAIQRTQTSISQISSRIATGNRVNSAIDNPQNFFNSKELLSRANNFTRLLDDISQSVRTIEQAVSGITAISNLLNQANAVAQISLEAANAGETDPAVFEVPIGNPTPLSTQIQNDNPVAYFRLNDAGGTAVNLGSGGAAINGTYQGGVTNQSTTLYTNGGDVSTDFDGATGGVYIPDSALINTAASYPQRTIELVFNADDVNSRQVLFEEGATVNGLTIYINSGEVIVTGEDDGNFADVRFADTINAGETNHVALVFDQSDNSIRGYLNGTDIGSATVGNQTFPAHGGDIGIGYAPDGVQFSDGESAAGGFNFDGRISDVAIYNTALSAADIQARSDSLFGSSEFRNSNFEAVLDQVNQLIEDASFQGINLLGTDSLTTYFNPGGSSSLVTEGVDLSFEGLGILRSNFNVINEIEAVISSVDDALNTVENFAFSLSNDLSIIQTRSNFTEDTINTLQAGSDDLTLADLNEEAASLLAAQTGLAVAQEALAFGAQSNRNILSLISGSSSLLSVDI